MGVLWYFFSFFFQAEDGIRDDLVTGVQTCALPISAARFAAVRRIGAGVLAPFGRLGEGGVDQRPAPVDLVGAVEFGQQRSEERRVGKEWRSGWWRDN